METDKWNDVFQELRDFSPTPPASVKAAIDQQLMNSAATQTLGSSMKWLIYLSSFILLVSTGLGIYFFSQSTTTNSSKDVAVNSINTTTNSNSISNQHSNSKQENNSLTSKDSELIVKEHLKNSLQQKESISTVGIKSDAKLVSVNDQKSPNKIKSGFKSEINLSNKSRIKSSNKSLKIKNESSVVESNTKFNKTTNSNKTTVKSTKNSTSKTAKYNSKEKNKEKNLESNSKSGDLAENITETSSLKSKESNTEVKTSSTQGNSNGEEATTISVKTSTITENKLTNSDSNDLVENGSSIIENSTKETLEKVEEKKDLTDKNGGKPNLKNEFGVYGGPMFTSNQRKTNLPSVQLQSKTGIQVNAYYGFRLNDRLKVNAGISYQNYKEKLSQNSPATSDSVVTSFTVIYIPNPVDTTLIDTIITPIYTLQTTPAVNASNEIQLNRFGLNTGLSFLVYENPKMQWSYNVRIGHQLYYSQQRSLQNDLSGYSSTIGKWSGAVYFDNYLSKNIGLLNVTLGVSSTYDYTSLTNWSGIEKKRLYFSPYIGFSMQF